MDLGPPSISLDARHGAGTAGGIKRSVMGEEDGQGLEPKPL